MTEVPWCYGIRKFTAVIKEAHQFEPSVGQCNPAYIFTGPVPLDLFQ
jgi:hypothetical protein